MSMCVCCMQGVPTIQFAQSFDCWLSQTSVLKHGSVADWCSRLSTFRQPKWTAKQTNPIPIQQTIPKPKQIYPCGWQRGGRLRTTHTTMLNGTSMIFDICDNIACNEWKYGKQSPKILNWRSMPKQHGEHPRRLAIGNCHWAQQVAESFALPLPSSVRVSPASNDGCRHRPCRYPPPLRPHGSACGKLTELTVTVVQPALAVGVHDLLCRAGESGHCFGASALLLSLRALS